nr:MAG TPA: hypothetical protein [Caudoviricetes sp.]
MGTCRTKLLQNVNQRKSKYKQKTLIFVYEHTDGRFFIPL